MRIVAKGQFDGEDVEVTWSKADFLDGPGPVCRALIRESASLTGTVMGDPLTFTVDSGFLEHDFGFKQVSKRVLSDVAFTYPDGEPETLPESPPGFVA